MIIRLPLTRIGLNPWLFVYWIGIVSMPVFGQANTFQQLEKKVYQLNNAMKYDESQKLLLPVLQSERYSADEKYQVALLLSYTYKRLQDYISTLQFLETARQFARQTNKKDQYLATIQCQEAFVYFDTHAYKKADKLMKRLEKNKFRHIDLENKAKLVMQQGYLLFMAQRYPQAEATYDRAIGWLRTASACDLPMIYVKKMQLYAAMNRMDKVKEALRESTHSADSCAILKYHIYAHEELLKIYTARNDVAGIAATVRKVDSLNFIYARADHIAALHNQKEGMLLAEKERALTEGSKQRTYLMVGLTGSGLLVVGLLIGLLMYKRRKRKMEDDFLQMQRELQAFVVSNRTESVVKPADKKESVTVLSDRQKEILMHMASGLSNRDIAGKLFVSENTVKYHIKNIYQLLDIKDRKELLVNFRE